MPFSQTEADGRRTDDVPNVEKPRLGILGSQQGQARPLLTKSYAGNDLSMTGVFLDLGFSCLGCVKGFFKALWILLAFGQDEF